VKAADFVFASGQPIALEVTADHGEVKVLLYGPGGVGAGPGGPYGGSDAWVDHYHRGKDVKVDAGSPGSVTLENPASAREGFYRVVAVDLATGQSASAGFCVYSQAVTDELRSLSSRIELPAGSRLIFVGDSLTAFFRGRNYVDLVGRAIASRHGAGAEVINAGVGGDSIVSISKRLDRDVIVRQPTHVFIFEGANDSKRNFNPENGLSPNWAVPYEIHVATYRQVVEKLKALPGAGVVIMTMAPGDQRIIEPFRERARTFGTACNFFCVPEAEARAVAFQKQLAAEFELPVIDTHKRLAALLEVNDPPCYLNVDDGVHLSERGNLEVALAVLHYLAEKR